MTHDKLKYRPYLGLESRIVQTVILVVVALLVSYGLGAFSEMTFDASLWDVETRVAISWMWMGFNFLIIFVQFVRE